MWDGGTDRGRTCDAQSFNLALYQLSYGSKWCQEPKSNRRHMDFQSTALPAELSWHISVLVIMVEHKTSSCITQRIFSILVMPTRFELVFTAWRAVVLDQTRRRHQINCREYLLWFFMKESNLRRQISSLLYYQYTMKSVRPLRQFWRLRWNSNPQPPPWQGGALTNWTTEPY